ncbi:TNF receptor-associated factor 5-like [Ruditapes philippinarum]|uniref:TNF receptor-associated factor 5-like n=1 Tax=Ruditapes philippinarum TaxID=129788 RepID=UPI00295C01F3|nr:TNF receptor-associated factor 5-like [Ruditapes philippinarum]XP_060606659.1 TNF receptor-associated factor 5-like [Ruditapes philippinarum]
MASNSTHSRTDALGYEAVFVDEPERKYMCPVCLVVMKDAVQTSCGHRFCEICIKKVAKRSGICKCPVDNTWFDTQFEMFPDVAIRREILSLKVKCDQHHKGCNWTGELRCLDLHVTICDYIEVTCEYGCPEGQIRRKDLTHHLETCDLRPVCCEHCNSSTSSVYLTKHQLLDCRKFPVTCSLCGKSRINREDISGHLNEKTGDCPRVIIPCPYQKYGCQFAGRREVMSSHGKEAAHVHMTFMEQKIESQDKRICSLDNTVKELTKTLAEFDSVMEKLKESQMMSYNGKQSWKVEILPGQNKYRSRSFYTGCPGYKLHVSLELNGHTEAGHSYASLFVIHEKGQFDEELFFPFSASCGVTLVSTLRTRIYETEVTCTSVPKCRTDAEQFQCQRGRLRFIRMDQLLSDTFCVDNCLYMEFKAQVFQHGSFIKWGSNMQT